MLTSTALLSTPVLAILGVLLGLSFWALKGTGAALILTKFTVANDPASYEKVVIHGRVGGIVGWLLHQMGLEAESCFRATANEITIDRTGLSGFSSFCIPFHESTSSSCQYYRAIGFLFLAIALPAWQLLSFCWTATTSLNSGWTLQRACASSWPGLATACLASLFFYALYAASKRIVVRIETGGGNARGVAFKRSLIENATIDLDKTLEAVDVLNRLIDERGNARGLSHAAGR